MLSYIILTIINDINLLSVTVLQTPEALSNWINKLAPRNRFEIENCLMGMARDHKRRVSLLNQHIGFAVRERATLQQLGNLLFPNEPGLELEETPLLAHIRNNEELRQLYDEIISAGYDEEVEAQTRVDVNAQAGEQVFSMMLAKQHYANAPPSSLPQLRVQLDQAGTSLLPRPTEIVDLCSESDEDGSNYVNGGDEKRPRLHVDYAARDTEPPLNPM